MFLQPQDVGVVQEFGIVFYLSALAVMLIVFAMAIKLMGDYDGD